MILEDLQNYIQENRIVSIYELTERFDTDIDAIREMLAVLVRKNKIRKIENLNVGGCGKCAQCNIVSDEIYEWIGGE